MRVFGRSLCLMFRDVLTSLAPLVGLCDHPLRLAELILLALCCTLVGCCCGGLITACVLSPWIRQIAAQVLVYLLDPEGRVREAGLGLAGQHRLQRHRA